MFKKVRTDSSLVQEMGLEPTQSIPQAPEACVSTNSTTLAKEKPYK